MSIEDYKQAGYSVSALIAQAQIDRAEADVMQAYIMPLQADADPIEDVLCRRALMELVMLLVLQRSIFATRSGAKEKQMPQSYSADRWNILSQSAMVCSMKLRTYAESTGVTDWRKRITDICGVYFDTNFLNLK